MDLGEEVFVGLVIVMNWNLCVMVKICKNWEGLGWYVMIIKCDFEEIREEFEIVNSLW